MNTPNILRAETIAANERDLSKPMARFAIRNLSAVQYTNGFTLWHYRSKAITDPLTPNYFSDAANMMKLGDHIHVSAPDGGALLNIQSVTDTVVTVSKMMEYAPSSRSGKF